MTETDSSTPRSFAAAVRQRRHHFGWTQADIQGRGGPATATQRKLENGSADSFSARSIRQLERALGWPEGIARHFDAGTAPDGWPRDFEEWAEVAIYTTNYDQMWVNNTTPVDPDRPLFKISSAPDLDEATEEELLAELQRRFDLYRLKGEEDENSESQQEQRSPTGSSTGRAGRRRGTPMMPVPDSPRPAEPDWSDLTGKAARRVPRELRDPNYVDDEQ